MTFPDSKRVIYAQNTLEEVICQVKFPPVLKISETPVEFQEKIRTGFPLLEEKPAVDLPANIPPELARIMVGVAGGSKFQFLSRDKNWTVSLFRDFLALSCSSYKRWEDFQDHFEGPFAALNEEYSPAFFNRIGLRYRNVIRRQKLGLESVPWSELLKPPICGELATPYIRDNIEEAARELLIQLGDGRKVRLVHWLIQKEDAYVIDADFFIESEVEAGNVTSQLNTFNRESGRLIRWAITDKLHAAMGPTDA